MKAHISKKKKEELNLLVSLIKKYPIIGIINLLSLPAAQLQKMKAQLRSDVLIRITKKRLIKLAFNQIKDEKDLSSLLPYLEQGIPALLFTNKDPFKLAKIIKKSKSMVKAKAGQISPSDIIVPAGPTEFPPGPIIGELGQVGILAGVEAGKVAIKKDSTVVKTGQVISPKLADILSKLGFEPMEIGLNLMAVYDNGTIFVKSVLEVDEQTYIKLIKQYSSESLALALSIGYPNKETIRPLLSKAYLAANVLGNKIHIENIEIEKEHKPDFKEAKEEKIEVKEEPKQKTREEISRLNMQKASYSEEESRKAQEIINAMKDKNIQESDRR